jgi:hypothetical protein
MARFTKLALGKCGLPESASSPLGGLRGGQMPALQHLSLRCLHWRGTSGSPLASLGPPLDEALPALQQPTHL